MAVHQNSLTKQCKIYTRYSRITGVFIRTVFSNNATINLEYSDDPVFRQSNCSSIQTIKLTQYSDNETALVIRQTDPVFGQSN